MGHLTNADVLFLIQLVDAHRHGAHLMCPGESLRDFERYQVDLMLKLTALDLDAVYKLGQAKEAYSGDKQEGEE